MTRRAKSFSELRWPDDPDGAELAENWATGLAVQVLDLTWRAFDLLYTQDLSQIDWNCPFEQLERDLVRIHFMRIMKLYTAETDGFATFFPAPEWPEMESRSGGAAKPPSYDLAYIPYCNARWAWPLEAKVLPTAGQLAEYMKDVNDKFVMGVAAPLTGEGAMIGYLLVDDADTAFTNLEARLNQKLAFVTEFLHLPHRVSQHQRNDAPLLRLHHLMMVIVAPSQHAPVASS